MNTMRVKGADTENEGWPLVIVVDRITDIQKVDEEHCEVYLDNGRIVLVKEQLNVLEARLSLAKDSS